MFVRMRLGRTRRQGADKRNHLDHDGFVIVPKTRERAHDLNHAAELFPDLAEDGGGGRLTGLDLSAGEFPFQGQKFVRRTLGEKDQTGPFDHRTNDRNGL